MSLTFSPIKFIEEVKVRPALYQAELAADRAMKIRLWKEVGAALFPDWDTCNKATAYDRVLQMQKKWRSFRDAYIRELRNRRRPKTSRPRKSYKYFKRLSFLGGHDGNVSSPGESGAEDESERLLYPMNDDYTENSILPDEDSDSPLVKTSKKKYRKRNNSSDSIHAAEEYEIPMPMFKSITSDVSDDSDSDKLFLMSFAPEMRQLPPNIKMWARAQIANIMQEAVNCHYNNTMPGNSVILNNGIEKHNSD